MSTAVVYLVHFDTPVRHARHFLGVAASEAAIDIAADVARTPILRAGAAAGAAAGAVTDVWEAGSLADALTLREAFRRQGSRARLCSVCNPGNSRGAGTGKWDRAARVAAGQPARR